MSISVKNHKQTEGKRALDQGTDIIQAMGLTGEDKPSPHGTGLACCSLLPYLTKVVCYLLKPEELMI
jgi:hypothetical protein